MGGAALAAVDRPSAPSAALLPLALGLLAEPAVRAVGRAAFGRRTKPACAPGWVQKPQRIMLDTFSLGWGDRVALPPFEAL